MTWAVIAEICRPRDGHAPRRSGRARASTAGGQAAPPRLHAVADRITAGSAASDDRRAAADVTAAAGGPAAGCISPTGGSGPPNRPAPQHRSVLSTTTSASKSMPANVSASSAKADPASPPSLAQWFAWSRQPAATCASMADPCGRWRATTSPATDMPCRWCSQSPYDSLNPRMSVRHIIAEPIWRHGLASRSVALDRALDLMGNGRASA